ncbi:hypothetical protein AAKU55_004589 [Oxalobacteraceae bacterium GrIS 1.11]
MKYDFHDDPQIDADDYSARAIFTPACLAMIAIAAALVRLANLVAAQS